MLVGVTDKTTPADAAIRPTRRNIFRRDRRASVVHSPTGRKRLPKESIDLWLVSVEYLSVCLFAGDLRATYVYLDVPGHQFVDPLKVRLVSCVFRCCSRDKRGIKARAGRGMVRKTLVVKKKR